MCRQRSADRRGVRCRIGQVSVRAAEHPSAVCRGFTTGGQVQRADDVADAGCGLDRKLIITRRHVEVEAQGSAERLHGRSEGRSDGEDLVRCGLDVNGGSRYTRSADSLSMRLLSTLRLSPY